MPVVICSLSVDQRQTCFVEAGNQDYNLAAFVYAGPELVQPIDRIRAMPANTMDEFVTALRHSHSNLTPNMAISQLEEQGICCANITISPSQHWPMELTILSPKANDSSSSRHGIVWHHGGGTLLNVTVVSVEYRPAPEYPAPIPQNDCFEALVWTAKSVKELNIDPKRLMVGGGSAGAGLAASVVQRARDEERPTICGQFLISPMLDDRNETESSHRCIDDRIWGKASNLWAWKALLGKKSGLEGVHEYVAPGRAKDLSSLPPTFVSVGALEPFTDEACIYAKRIRDSFGLVEAHVWPVAYHAFESVVPEAKISIIASQVRRHWVARIFKIIDNVEVGGQSIDPDNNFLG